MKRSVHQHAGLKFSVAESGVGKPFVFQHGLCGDASQPAQVFPEHTKFRCVTIECRGHGLSEPGAKDGLTIATFADDIVRYIQASGMNDPVLGGISMGAAISLRIAVRMPRLIKALVIARPAWLAESNPDNMRPNALAGELLERLPPAEALREFESSETAAELRRLGPDNLNSIRGFFSREPIGVTSALLRQISADGPGVSESEIRRIAVPTLVIGHGRDVVHPLSYARTLAEWIPGARFAEITPKAESPEAYQADFKAALAAFLKDL
jgi:pimeloyl-ACP methyl ester carboxylesterase